MNKPKQGNVYALTSADGPCIANGNSWEESCFPGTTQSTATTYLDICNAIKSLEKDVKAPNLDRKFEMDLIEAIAALRKVKQYY